MFVFPFYVLYYMCLLADGLKVETLKNLAVSTVSHVTTNWLVVIMEAQSL
jgi:hypothetical protein